jgi:methylmalonyl-CoA/ethylmalonyl-CoA epimerase
VSQTFEDPIQRSRVAFLDLPTPGAVQLELVEPAAADSPVARFLEKGGGLHHLCYEVDDLQRQIQWMKSQRAVLIRSPKPAVAFGGRRIAWMRTRDSLLIEYLERRLPG